MPQCFLYLPEQEEKPRAKEGVLLPPSDEAQVRQGFGLTPSSQREFGTGLMIEVGGVLLGGSTTLLEPAELLLGL